MMRCIDCFYRKKCKQKRSNPFRMIECEKGFEDQKKLNRKLKQKDRQVIKEK